MLVSLQKGGEKAVEIKPGLETASEPTQGSLFIKKDLSLSGEAEDKELSGEGEDKELKTIMMRNPDLTLETIEILKKAPKDCKCLADALPAPAQDSAVVLPMFGIDNQNYLSVTATEPYATICHPPRQYFATSRIASA